MKNKYDYLIVGCGLFGSVFAHELKKRNKKCLIIEKRNHIGGNIYTEKISGINVHKYGAHIFHTNNKEVWDYVNSFAEFNRYTNSTILSYTYEKLGDQPKLTDISNNYHGLIDLSGNERYDILDRWYHTYPDPFQFLTVNDN